MENTRPNNPSAFPYTDENNSDYKRGMTLRDYFANSAMQAILSQPNIGEYLRGSNCETMEDTDNMLAITAFRLADAMLKQREL